MRLYQAIDDANSAGRRGLIFYTIPNYPDPAAYAACVDYLNQRLEVSIVETTIPVSDGFSPYASEVIRAAHRAAARFTPDEDALLRAPRARQPQICVLYEQTEQRLGFRGVLQRFAGLYDGVLLEWSQPDDAPHVAACQQAGVEFIQAIGPGMTESQMRLRLAKCAPLGLVYVMSAAKTGGELFDGARISDCLQQARAIRSDLKFVAGFGIATAQDVRALRAVAGLDGLIVGTSFLAALAKGRAPTQELINSIIAEL